MVRNRIPRGVLGGQLLRYRCGHIMLVNE